MCLIAFAWKCHPVYDLIVAANRDEWLARPSARLHWWGQDAEVLDDQDRAPRHCEFAAVQDAEPSILAGRDLKQGGTWMGVNANGHVAAVTSVRLPRVLAPDERLPASATGQPARSRGLLVSDYLKAGLTPADFLLGLIASPHHYDPFNLLVADGAALYWFNNLTGQAHDVAPGVHCVSNARLNTPWPKVERARLGLADALQALPDTRRLWAILADTTPAPDAELPDTQAPREWERLLAPIHIVAGQHAYGTRSSTVMLRTRWGQVNVDERLRSA